MAPPAPVAACIELIKARPGTQAVLLGGHGVLAFGPDTETTVSLLVALEEAAEAELRTAVLGRLSAPPGTLHIWGMAAGERCVPWWWPGPPGPGGSTDRPSRPAGSAVGPPSPMVRGWTSAFAS